MSCWFGVTQPNRHFLFPPLLNLFLYLLFFCFCLYAWIEDHITRADTPKSGYGAPNRYKATLLGQGAPNLAMERLIDTKPHY